MAYPRVANPSFEEDSGFIDFPGYAGDKRNPTTIIGWTVSWSLIGSGSGIWVQEDGAWANNGILPDGAQFLFLQMTAGNTGCVSQVVSGFRQGKNYILNYDFNVRDYLNTSEPANSLLKNKASVVVTLNGQEIDRFDNAKPVEPYALHTQPWHHRRARPFPAGPDESYELRFYFALNPADVPNSVSGSPSDSAIVLDNIWFDQDPPDPNTPPIVEEIQDRQVQPGNEVRLQVSAWDTNEPPQRLSYSLEPGSADGAYITDQGEFSWFVPSDFPEGDYPITVVVTDNGTPPNEARASFVVNVGLPKGPALSIHLREDGVPVLTWASVPGTAYQVQSKSAFEAATWDNLGSPVVFPDSAAQYIDSTPAIPRRFYRLQLP